MSKFTVGDLVTLSASGCKNIHNKPVLGMIGIIVEIRTHHRYPFQVKWIGLNDESARDREKLPMKKYEIKFVKSGVVPCG